MSYSCLILGESGSGKTCSLRNLDPKKTLLIQPIRKPLPFPSKGWKEIKEKGDGNNIVVTDDPLKIMKCMKNAPFDVIVIDDFQYILANMFMQRRNEKSFEKFTELAGVGFDLVKLSSELAPDKRVYILGHTETDDYGKTRIKTLGKMLNEKLVLEGLFTTVLRTFIEGDNYYFSTQNSGSDTVKSPMGLFADRLIENDLSAVDAAICSYYDISPTEEN